MKSKKINLNIFKMKKNSIIYKSLGILLLSAIFLTSCDENFEEFTNESSKADIGENFGKALLDISYDMQTSQDYDVESLKLSSLDLAAMNPKSEKQHIQMQLFENGQMNLTIEELDFERKIKILHKILPDDSPKIVRTEIIGGMSSFYDKNGILISMTPIDLPNQLEMVNKIKTLGNKFSREDLNNTMAAIQGQQLIDDLEELTKNASKYGVRIMEQGQNYVTLRMSQKHIDSRIEEEVVYLVDKNLNRIVGNRIYSADNRLLQTTFFGYSKDEEKYLNAIRLEQKVALPSGKEVNSVTQTKIGSLKFNLNIQ